MRGEETVLAEAKQYIGLSNATVPDDEHLSQVIVTNVPLHFDFYTSNKVNDQIIKEPMRNSIPHFVKPALQRVYLAPEYPLLSLPVFDP